MPSTVTWRSSMASSRADWVLGVARLISSASTIWAKIGPGRNSNSRLCWLKIETPVTSEGSRSGVNWMRLKLQPIERAMRLASIVLPTPGTSSSSTWPSQSRATSSSSTTSRLPTITRSTFWKIRSANCLTVSKETSLSLGPGGRRPPNFFIVVQKCASVAGTFLHNNAGF